MSNHGVPSVSWWSATAPTTGPTGTSAIWVGLQFGFSANGWIEGFRCYCGIGNDGNFQAILWLPSANELLAAYRFKPRLSTSAAGWQQTWIRPRVPVNTTDTYRLAALYIGGGRFQTTGSLSGGPVTHNNIDFVNSFTSTALAVQTATVTLATNAPGIDVLFRPSA